MMEDSVAYHSCFSMGTRFDIVLPGFSPVDVEYLFKLIENELDRLENLFSLYIEESVINAINRQAAKTFFPVKPDVLAILDKVINISGLCKGYFDFRFGGLKNLDSKIDFSSLPWFNTSLEESFEIDIVKVQLKKNYSEMVIDTGGFGKGLALDAIKDLLVNSGISEAFISFGGSSIAGLGKHPLGDSWVIGIPDVYTESSQIVEYRLKDMFLSISGNTLANMKKYTEGHIINPKTGKMFKDIALQCVVGNSALVTEILSTSLLLATHAERIEILSGFNGFQATFINYPVENQIPELHEYK
jgi:FAD:protein FMN transferase